MYLNGTLRQGGLKNKDRKNGFTVTISMVNSAVLKLSKISLPRSNGLDNKLYRGVSRMAMPDDFFQEDERHCRGFVEPGFTSTTTDRNVAIHYAGSREDCPSIFEINTGQVTSCNRFIAKYIRFVCRARTFVPLSHAHCSVQVALTLSFLCLLFSMLNRWIVVQI
jgi:hypothetical protein